jgi:arylsulfatase A-like enzyme
LKHYSSFFLALVCVGCSSPPTLSVDMPLRLEDHLDAATITGSELPANPPQTVEWRFDQPQPDWKPTPLWNPPFGTPTLTLADDGLRVALTNRTRVPNGQLRGVIHVDVPEWQRGEWADVVIRARAESTSSVNIVGLGFNLRKGRGTGTTPRPPFQFGGQNSRIVRDGTIQTYRLRVNAGATFEGPWQQLAIVVGSDGEPGSIDLLSVSVVPKEAEFADSATGLRDIDRESVTRPAFFTHAPARLTWRVKVPEGGHLGVALATLAAQAPVVFSVVVTVGSRDTTVFRETVTDESQWYERGVNLAAFAGRTVDLSLRTESDRPGQIGFWGSPILSGAPGSAARGNRPPNVIVYVIDGGGADLMGLYGYSRRTTPNLERLAAEGVVFERAHSNSAWTKPSTASFMTGLQHSALGGFRSYGDRIPEGAPIMAQRFRAAGYQTAHLTFHPNAGGASGLSRGVDRYQHNNPPGHAFWESSRFLPAAFWDWREAFPGSPYWAHFQVTDVHEPQITLPPFEGLFVKAERRERFMGPRTPGGRFCWECDGWLQRLRNVPGWGRADRGEVSLAAQYRETLATLGIDRIEFYDIQRGLYDETMARVDHHFGRFVERLKAQGEWENTILIVTADHGHPAGSHTRFGRELFDPVPAETEGAFFDSYRTRVPLVIVAPGRLPAGVRIREAVSLVDLLPTVLDLAGLPPLERTQGRSLVPLMRGDPEWETRPVILEQLERDVRTDEFTGHIEMIDGRWGASLEIWPERGPGDPPVQPSRWEAKARFHVDGAPRLLLYDLWEDPFTRQNVNDRFPELVEKYTRLLEEQWQAHLAMAALYKTGGQVELSPEQLETLRALGYIR